LIDWRLGASALLVIGAVVPAVAEERAAAPDFTPVVALAFTDPSTGERVECAQGCRRFSVPDGAVLEIRVRVENRGGDIGEGAVAWDLWLNEPMHPFPGLDLEPCFDSGGRLDQDCWQSLTGRFDAAHWQQKISDRICVPVSGSSCDDVTVRVPVDAGFEGARKTGTYHVAVWVDRAGVTAERNEFNNFAGPIRVSVESRLESAQLQPPATEDEAHPGLIVPTQPQPYSVVLAPVEVEDTFYLASDRSVAEFEFAPHFPGPVSVEVDQGGVNEVMTVTVTKALTGEALIEERGRNLIRFDGRIDAESLKDDRSIMVEVRGGPAIRGLRGTIQVAYPERALYRVTN
jgi:hypothetical protein